MTRFPVNMKLIAVNHHITLSVRRVEINQLTTVFGLLLIYQRFL